VPRRSPETDRGASVADLQRPRASGVSVPASGTLPAGGAFGPPRAPPETVATAEARGVFNLAT
jgi:hypothetical protein